MFVFKEHTHRNAAYSTLHDGYSFSDMLQDILKHTPKNHHDRENLQEGLTGIENVAHQLNEGKRRSEQQFHGQEIISKLSTKIAADKKAYLIRQDDVKQLSEVGLHFVIEIDVKICIVDLNSKCLT